MKKISTGQLYEAMEGIGDDLLARSEEVAAASGGKRNRKRMRGVYIALGAAAALLLAIAATGTRRMGNGATSSSDSAAPALMQQAAGESGPLTESAPDAGALPDEKAEATAAGASFAAAAEAENDALTEEAVTGGAFFYYDGRLYLEEARMAYDAQTVGDVVVRVREEQGLTPDPKAAENAHNDGLGSFSGDIHALRKKSIEEALVYVKDDGTMVLFRAIRP